MNTQKDKEKLESIVQYDINIEKAVIAALLFVPQTYDKIRGILTSECFHNPIHKDIYRVIPSLDLEKSQMPMKLYDILFTVNENVRKHNPFSNIDFSYLASLTGLESDNIELDARVLKELYAKRNNCNNRL